MSFKFNRSPNHPTNFVFHNNQLDTVKANVPEPVDQLCSETTPGVSPISNCPSCRGRCWCRCLHTTQKLIEYLSRSLHVSILYFSYLVLLGLPLYYASRASLVIDLASRDLTTCPEAATGTIVGSQDINLGQGYVPAESDALGSLDSAPAFLNITSVTPSHSSALPSSHPFGPAFELQVEWVNYINMRIAEWKILFTVACVFVAVSLTIFQIPTAIDEPFTRAFTSVAVCRAFSGIVYGPIFPLFFQCQYTRTPHFAMVWFNETKAEGRRLTILNPWVMISLPAASTLCALIFYFLSILSVTWGTTTSTTRVEHAMVTPLILATRSAIVFFTLVDIACLVGIVLTLRRLKALCYRTPDLGV